MKDRLRAIVILTCQVLLCVPAIVGAAQLEIRFCPSTPIHTYPLDSRRGLQSMLLHNVAFINHATNAFALNAIELEVLKGGEVVDSRKFDKTAIKAFADKGMKLQSAGLLEAVAFQFCGTNLIGASTKLAGPVLEQDQALLVASQFFSFGGPRDTLRVRVWGDVEEEETEVIETKRIISDLSTNSYLFPLSGVWFVGVGATPHTAHRWVIPEEFALDIAKLGSNGLSHKGAGTKFKDYYAYGVEVLAAADGQVVGMENAQPENASDMRQPNETEEAYFARLNGLQMSKIAKGVSAVAGNYVMLAHSGGEYSFYAHLKRGSVRVRLGDHVKAGAVLGQLGSSGNSTEPHLHFQVCDGPDPLMSAGIPVNFKSIKIQWADLPRPVQSGDLIIAR